jgi:hypothetical protein
MSARERDDLREAIEAVFEGTEFDQWPARPARVPTYAGDLFVREMRVLDEVHAGRTSDYVEALMGLKASVRTAADLVHVSGRMHLPMAEAVQRPSLEELISELNNPTWEFRTAEGIAEALGTEASEIEAIFDKYPELVRWLPARDEQGRQLLVSKRRSPSWKERHLRLRAYAAKLS